MLDTLIQFGPWGMFLASFLAGSFFPFSSEAVMLALLAMGVDPSAGEGSRSLDAYSL